MNIFHYSDNCPKIKGATLFFKRNQQYHSFFGLTAGLFSRYLTFAAAKSVAERDNSINLPKANNHTRQACFFIHSIRTSKERFKKACSSMVACSGKGSPFADLPLVSVCHPVTRYRQSVTTFAVTLEKLTKGVTAMFIYIFAAIRRSDYCDTTRRLNQLPKITLHVKAENENQARALLSRDYFLISVGRINPTFKNTAIFGRGLTGNVYLH
ncbi:MAG: host cell division inhibitor Icd-like protein [Pasteurellaceae bacterium]|nr:host cell division inhibitor Icd-like protein [Pasteurellaceae bacterium]